ncbi:ammonium transporter [Mycolicibacterium fortuitum]|uniref:Ammonium transporter n=3 Tax=Mycolicibacterium fortuitum TaxID=1766 RepID=A0A0N9YDG8_MYCFO|nr:ammonium transporter [Mycolicibacterium fortuitum]AIY49851.1 Ammonium transporter [Mycobacterium sp. VKM Ac-1817D]CRL81778.1 ammonium transporter [Mycolicibacter nonchromogenicus]ALI29425.1 Ammonium transporter [Mycolicibacterium fortuitum]EJZ14092.1 ammonium transporter [Mycolicibacterium fortuitum subsp. fortuitum DSM 46621 = ATCC 6841 = JCM 6387]MBP3084359.1 ammonium transporter [Mycolicibacterium fortuitum]
MDTGTTAFMLCCIIGLTLMIPGLALFYGGMVSVKSSTNMMMMTFGAVALVGVLWVLFGFSMAFGTSYGDLGLLGSITEFAGMKDLVEPMTSVNGLPVSLFSLFQALFAAITVALISGAVADRMKFGAWMIFAGIWAVLVYFPVAHWVFAFDKTFSDDSVGGWIANKLHAVDFAGGTAVHINAGAAALAVAIVLGKSAMFGQLRKPHNVPLTLLGAGMLWAGWYAFNGGSALAAGNSAAIVMVTTFVATCAATLAWIAVEKLKTGHVTGVGAASGAIAGLVAITPACGAVTPVGAIVLGAIAGALCILAVGLKEKLGYDDSLDVVGVHLVGGVIGTLLIGFLASEAMPSKVSGLLYGGGLDQLWKQAIAAGAVAAYSFAVAFAIAYVLKKTIGIRISAEEEEKGIDSTFHRDSAYELEFA